jgi:hypothetical protein
VRYRHRAFLPNSYPCLIAELADQRVLAGFLKIIATALEVAEKSGEGRCARPSPCIVTELETPTKSALGVSALDTLTAGDHSPAIEILVLISAVTLGEGVSARSAASSQSRAPLVEVDRYWRERCGSAQLRTHVGRSSRLRWCGLRVRYTA